MALSDFDHLKPGSLEEAEALASSRGRDCALVAGGTDLLGILKDHVHASPPSLVLDLKGLPGLVFIRQDEEGARIGALTTIDQIAKSPILRELYPLVAKAARAVASPQIRNMGTLGGNICQEPRCWYYRNPEGRFICLRKGGGACNAIAGENRFHSIYGAARVGTPACRDSCPAMVEIPLYLAQLRAGDVDAAAKIILRRNPMPAVTGRVCPHRCEKGCNRGEMDAAVSVRAIERKLGDYILESAGRLMPPPTRATGLRVAVVGSGPAGLSAAYYARRSGHEVRVFERMPAAGGMLAYGIPAYRLPKDVLAALIKAYEGMGIAFELGSAIGETGESLQALRGRFDRVFLATGAWRQKTISIPGAERLDSGLDFLIDIQKGERARPGDKVLVIGGGNVAVDVAISALRLGAREVTMACLEARSIMPAFPEDLEEALREGVRLLPSWGPQRVIERGGALVGMELVQCTSVFDAEGRFRPSFDPGRTMKIDADRVFLAIGQAADLSYAAEAVKIERGLVVAAGESQATSLEAVYAGGDATTGPASVVEALASGRRAAKAFFDDDAFEGGDAIDGLHAIRMEALGHSERSAVASLAPSLRSISAEDIQAISQEELVAEAHRCVDCGCVAVNASDLAPALVALDAVVRTTRRSIPAEEFFAARLMKTTALGQGELVVEILLPAPEPGSAFGFEKFRIRNSIDFPIVSVAAAIVLKAGRIEKARIVLGAVAPLPLRLSRVEEFLRGRERSEETAEAAGALAAEGCHPLELNGYKVQIVKALLKKAIMTAS